MARKIDLAPRHIQYICSRGLAAGALAPSGYFDQKMLLAKIVGILIFPKQLVQLRVLYVSSKGRWWGQQMAGFVAEPWFRLVPVGSG